jgi:hypothetical protein
VASLRSELEKLRKEAASLRDESASRRIKAREESERALKLAEEKGEFDKVAGALRARLAELEPLEADAKAWRAHAEQEAKALDARRTSLPVHWQTALDAAGSVDGKRAVLAAHDAERATTAPAAPKHTPQASGAPVGASPDWATIMASSDIEAIRAAKAADPAGWAAMTSRNAAPRSLSTADRIAALRKSQQKSASAAR